MGIVGLTKIASGFNTVTRFGGKIIYAAGRLIKPASQYVDYAAQHADDVMHHADDIAAQTAEAMRRARELLAELDLKISPLTVARMLQQLQQKPLKI